MTNKNANRIIGENLRILRVKQRKSQKVIGELLGYTSAQISNFELGKQQIKASDLGKLSEYFKVEINYFFKE